MGPASRRRCYLGFALLLAGCSSGTYVVPLSSAEKNLGNIAMAYADFHEKYGRGPKDAEELKPFLSSFGKPEELLVSPNDGQPFVIVWNADPTRGRPLMPHNLWPILAYEKQGKGGKRAVADLRGATKLLGADDFAQLTFAGKHKPSNN